MASWAFFGLGVPAEMAMDDTVIETVNLCKDFGGLRAVDCVNLNVKRQEFRAIIGPNGAGKTTLFNLLTGYHRSSSGEIFFQEHSITRLSPHRVCRRGISRTFQITSIFQNFTAFENVQAAVLAYEKRTIDMVVPAAGLFRERTGHLLEQVGLAEQAHKLASTLSHGDQKRLELALALASQPQVLLLDEPTAGMAVKEKPPIVELVNQVVKDKGLTVIMIEHDMDVVFSVAEKITVMHQGKVIAEGEPQAIRANEQVQAVYLGGEAHAEGRTPGG